MSVLGIVVLVWVAGEQDGEEILSATIPKAERSTYLPVLEKYKAAEAALASDPLECEHRCDELIADKAVRDAYREKRVRIQNTDGSYGDWTVFLPFQLRGRAKLARARALAVKDRGQAADLAREARKDLEVSVQKGVKSSERILEEARKRSTEYAEVKPEPDPRRLEANARMEKIRRLKDTAKPEEVLRECADAVPLMEGTDHGSELRLIRGEALRAGWSVHAGEGRFRSAGAFLTAHGGFLAKEEREKAEAEIERRCRKEIADRLVAFRARLGQTSTWAALKRLPPDEFDRQFAMPGGGELVVTDEDLEALRRCRDRLVAVRMLADPSAPPLAEFLRLVADVARTPEAVALALDLSGLRLAKAVEGAADLSSGDLRLRRGETEKVLAAVAEFAGGAEFRPQRQALEGYRSRLPDDLPRLDGIGKELLDPAHPKGVWGSDPELARDLEQELLKMPRERLSREARRKLGTYLLVAVASRLLLSGKPVAEVVQDGDLVAAAGLLDRTGGPLPDVMARVSPAIGDVAKLLKP